MSAFLASTLGIALLAMAALPGAASPLGGDPLAIYRWKARVLVVVAPAADDAKLLRQREVFRGIEAGARERDLVLVEAIGDSEQARTLRREFALDDRFHAVLVGKDGGGKLTSDEPLDADALFPLIDSMPMRQQEMRKKS